MYFFLRYFLRFRLISLEIVAGSTFRIFATSFCRTPSSRSACSLSLSAWVRCRYGLLCFFGIEQFSPKKIALQSGMREQGDFMKTIVAFAIFMLALAQLSFA